uniref:Uncharacterized protein n=1 Tax=Anguilla anguilla TaxID=7936 RepID=A0A0E9XR29_ANGAN
MVKVLWSATHITCP